MEGKRFWAQSTLKDNGGEEYGVSGEYSGVAGALGTCGRAGL